MSALDQALPLALSASLYPPALIVLVLLMTGERPRRLVLAYFLGAALVVVGAGLVGLVAFDEAGTTTQRSSSTSGGVYIALGLALLALAAYAWRRAHRAPPDPGPVSAAPSGSGRIAAMMDRATSSQKWAFALGVVMYLPSPMYLLAIKNISDSGSSSASNVAAVLICAVAVMLFVEVPLVALFVRPDGVSAALTAFDAWLKRNSWRAVAVLALLAGIYALVKGITTL